MDHKILNIPPEEIERRSFDIITAEMGEVELPPDQTPIVKRVIHTSADFEYVKNLRFSEGAVAAGLAALKSGAPIITDTQMAKAGINKRAAAQYGCEVHCFVADEEVAAAAKAEGVTRSRKAVDRAAALYPDGIYAVGNAPTALVRIYELYQQGVLRPRLVIGVPVGFVHVVESKQLILASDLPYIVAAGRKGGSNIAAAICNALLYSI